MTDGVIFITTLAGFKIMSDHSMCLFCLKKKKKINEKSSLVWLETSTSHIQAVLRYFPTMDHKIILEKSILFYLRGVQFYVLSMV